MNDLPPSSRDDRPPSDQPPSDRPPSDQPPSDQPPPDQPPPDQTPPDSHSTMELPGVPRSIGRYQVDCLLGRGAFGTVYLAFDEMLGRQVAIKVPTQRLLARQHSAESYLAEARAVARLDHPAIVPIYDVGSTSEYPCYLVSKYIEGLTLAQAAKESRFTFAQTAEIVATVADALDYSHQQGIFHRDVKPGNVLLDTDDRPHLVDYGLALNEADLGLGPRSMGTPGYMSPEQARGEGHRVDGRSDIFSLGCVLYELLAGSRPFQGKSSQEILRLVTMSDPRPPRQANKRIPRELERICLKAMARRATDRHTTAGDLAEDLRHFLASEKGDGGRVSPGSTNADSQAGSTDVATASASAGSTRPLSSGATAIPSWAQQPVRIMPKGLRAFDRHDADFFLELLPGPRDRDGVPEGVRFWKSKVEETDADATFATGVIYGPSGCGKSSFVRAGLLPLLGGHVTPLYLEATAEGLETRLLSMLRKSCADVSEEAHLAEAVATLRRSAQPGQKTLIVIDQFEQWLHARNDRDSQELIDAIRQCDGAHVQCLVTIRDDFWMAVTHFMRALEIRLSEGQNSLALDLFQPRHAKRVLASFGRAFGDLPADPAELRSEQAEFLEQAVEGLAEQGKVVCVRLALFAEMMKGRPWAPASLRQLGGAEGIGAAFLEEAFSSSTAPPLQRLHQEAARRVLALLLPPHGTEIKGHVQSREDLLDASGYRNRPQDFDELLRLLDSELRLITPTDLDGREETEARRRGYQLAHDYLVPSLRHWLLRKQRETRRGRAALRQQELAELWAAKPETRRLPTMLEWASFLVLTDKSRRSPPERRMIRAATKRHLSRVAAAVVLLAVLAGAVGTYRGRLETSALIGQLLTAKIDNVPGIVERLGARRGWSPGHLQAAVAGLAPESPEQLRASLGLLARDARQGASLIDRTLDATPAEIMAICTVLEANQVEFAEVLGEVLGDANRPATQRFNAALALAWLAGQRDQTPAALRQHGDFVAEQLVDRVLAHPGQAGLVEMLLPVRELLIDRLHDLFAADDGHPAARRVATGLLRDYASDMPRELTEMLLDADDDQFDEVFASLQPHAAAASSLLAEAFQEDVDSAASADERDRLGRRRANAAVGLARLGRASDVWPLLRHRPDPSARSWLIWRAPRLGVDPAPFADRLAVETDVSARRALLLTLGSFPPERLSAADRNRLVQAAGEMLQNDPDGGIHSAAEWLLRSWDEQAALKLDEPPRLDPAEGRRWYVAPEGHTMIVADGRDAEGVGRLFDISAKEVSVAQMRQWRPDKYLNADYSPSEDCPAGLMTWHQAIAYCQWLNVRAGIPEEQWCYPPFDPAEPGLPIYEADVSKTGFRLPTDAEWMLACGAGATTSRFFGEADQLLDNYSWCERNSGGHLHGVGQLMPNDWGLFDTYGNVSEWRADSHNGQQVSIGGGSAAVFARFIRTDDKGGAVPETRYNSYGLRLARTRAP